MCGVNARARILVVVAGTFHAHGATVRCVACPGESGILSVSPVDPPTPRPLAWQIFTMAIAILSLSTFQDRAATPPAPGLRACRSGSLAPLARQPPLAASPPRPWAVPASIGKPTSGQVGARCYLACIPCHNWQVASFPAGPAFHLHTCRGTARNAPAVHQLVLLCPRVQAHHSVPCGSSAAALALRDEGLAVHHPSVQAIFCP